MVSHICLIFEFGFLLTSRFDFIDAGSLISFLKPAEEEEIILYPALEVILDGSRIILPRDDEHRENIQLQESQRFLYLCFAEKRIQYLFKNEFICRNCLFPKKITDRRENVMCEQQVIPLRMITPIKCGKNNEGTLFWIYHEICFKKYFIDKGLQVTGIIDDNVTTANEIIIVFSYCSFKSIINEAVSKPATQKNETAFVQYEISSFTSAKKLRPVEFKTIFNENHYIQPSSLPYMPLCFKKKNQTKALKLMFPNSEKYHDYLIEQMMVPVDDIVKDIAKDSLGNYANVKPQWKSIQEDWELLGMFIKEKSKLELEKSFINSENGSHKGFTIYCGTYGELVNSNNEKIQIGGSENIDDKSAESDIDDKLEEFTIPETFVVIDKALLDFSKTCTVPVHWWKLIINTTGNKGIIIILPNYPKSTMTISSDIQDQFQALCEDVCHVYGWQEVKSFNKNIHCCEPRTELLKKLLYDFGKVKSIDETLNLAEYSEENNNLNLASRDLFFTPGDEHINALPRKNSAYHQILF